VLPESQLTTKVLVAITRYNNENLNNFNAKFRYSNFVSTIDSCDPSILNNDTFVTPYYLLTLQSGVASSFSFSYNAPILITSPTETTHPVASEKGMISSAFVKNGLTCQLEDDGIGNIRIVRVTSVNHVEVEKVGAIDYSTGDVVISNLLWKVIQEVELNYTQKQSVGITKQLLKTFLQSSLKIYLLGWRL